MSLAALAAEAVAAGCRVAPDGSVATVEAGTAATAAVEVATAAVEVATAAVEVATAAATAAYQPRRQHTGRPARGSSLT